MTALLPHCSSLPLDVLSAVFHAFIEGCQTYRYKVRSLFLWKICKTANLIVRRCCTSYLFVYSGSCWIIGSHRISGKERMSVTSLSRFASSSMQFMGFTLQTSSLTSG